MGAYAHTQNIFGNEANSLPLLSNKQSDNDVVSSFAYALNRPGLGCARRPRREK